MTVVIAELGQDVHIEGGLLEDAVNRGVRRGYTEGYLRKSVVRGPFDRVNTGDNTPAVLHVKLTEGDQAEADRRAQGLRQRKHEPPCHADPRRRSATA